MDEAGVSKPRMTLLTGEHVFEIDCGKARDEDVRGYFGDMLVEIDWRPGGTRVRVRSHEHPWELERRFHEWLTETREAWLRHREREHRIAYRRGADECVKSNAELVQWLPEHYRDVPVEDDLARVLWGDLCH